MFHLPEHFLSDIVATFAFGIVAIILLMIGFKTFDKLTPKVDFQETLKDKNLAVAIVIGMLFIAMAIIIHAVVSGILG
ncbi:MAG: DUF350 domain-containing protein [Verrucomicrobia bacterium]|nr:DUF350 domain-containing protein [Verrucomicrobiota bacterium]